MQTKIGAFAAKIAESGWLAALVVAPVYFNRYTVRIFEEDKVLLLRSIAAVILAALIIWGVEQGRRATTEALRCLWRLPLVKPALCFSAAYVLSTAFSIAPAISFWGAYYRCQGTYTWLCYMTIFFAIVLLVRRRAEIERIITVVLLSSLPVAVYGWIQHFGGDPIPWAGDVIARPSSTLGNPIFLSAFLIMVVPLTLVRVIEQFARITENPAAGQPRRRFALALLAAAYLLLLGLQLSTIVFSQSRGPVIGLGVGLLLFFLLLAVHYGTRWLVLAMAALAGGGLLFLIVFNLPNTPLAPLRNVKYLGRLGDVFEVSQGTGKVRILIWQGATDLLAADPVRDIVGYGPETMYLVYSRFYPAELGDHESRGVLPDRAHNETFDALVMLGVIGFVAQLTVFLCFFYYVLRWLGMIDTRAQRNAFIAATLTGGTLGGVVPYLIEGRVRFFGVGLPVGITLALMVFLMASASRRRKATQPRLARRDSLVLLALFSGVIAHFVEMHFGIALAATRLYFWTYVALAIAIGAPLLREMQMEPAAAGDPIEKVDPEATPELTGSLLDLSPIVGLILIVLTFAFYTPGFDISVKGWALLWIFLSVWPVGALVIVAEAMAEPGAHGHWRTRLSGYATTSLGLWLLFVSVYLVRLGWQPSGEYALTEFALLLATHTANTIPILYVTVLFAIFATATIAYLRDQGQRLASGHGWSWRVIPHALVAAGALVVVTLFNLQPVRADCFVRLGSSYADQRAWDAARALFEEGLRRRPEVAYYATRLARVLMDAGQESSDAAQRDTFFTDSEAVLQRAREWEPLNSDHVRNLARLYRMWAGTTADAALRARRYDDAEAYYRESMALSPQHVGVMNEWATLYLERKDPAKAFAKFEESLKIDDHYATTYWLRANTHFDAGRLEDALADYERALAIDSYLMAAWSGKALALARLNRPYEAIEASRRALAGKPDDVLCRRNLVLLYQQIGRYDLAIAEARTALGIAKGADRRPLDALIEQLNEESAAKAEAP